MLVTSIFSFSQNVFCPFRHIVQFLNHIHFVVCKRFSLDWSNILSFGIALTDCHFLNYTTTCIQKPLKESNESGLLQQVVFKCRFYKVDLRRVVVSELWSLKAGGISIQVVSNTGLTVFLYFWMVWWFMIKCIFSITFVMYCYFKDLNIDIDLFRVSNQSKGIFCSFYTQIILSMWRPYNTNGLLEMRLIQSMCVVMKGETLFVIRLQFFKEVSRLFAKEIFSRYI